MSTNEPWIFRDSGFLCKVEGTFFRSVAVDHVDAALIGSRRAGRYSNQDQSTLYLSASRRGVTAGMIAHDAPTATTKTVLGFLVSADNIFDMRDQDALARVRDAAGESFTDWREYGVDGGEPSSWRARNWIEAQGTNGLIDPSRKAPGSWHLVLFRWNVPGAPKVLPSRP